MGLAQPPADQSALPLAGADYKALYGFKGGNDGASPFGSLISVRGTLYGTTYGGGGGSQWGTVFSVSTGGTEHVLYRFEAGNDGAHPYGALAYVNGTLYGTTSQGGAAGGNGTVFAVTTSGKEHIVYSFKGGPNDGKYPYGNLIDVGGNLYGTTSTGGLSYGWGVVFKVTPGGSERVLYRFKANKDGAHPFSGLTMMGGKLYGTTQQGGADGAGTVFSITTAGAERVVYSFKGHNDGQYPYANLLDYKNELYGTTYQGGISTGWGTVFKVNASGSENVLYRFKAGSDGAHPYYAGLTLRNGTLYGTTYQGGASGAGAIYSVSFGGAENVVYSFKGSPGGHYPYGGLLDLSGALYGMTNGGGDDGSGTVFRFTP